MRWFLPVIFLSTLTLAVCPLGFTPEGACHADAPACLLFVDGDGDSYCDNPGPRGTVEEGPADELPGDSLVVSPDSTETADTGPADSLYQPSPDTLTSEAPQDTVLLEPAVPDSLPGPVDMPEPPPLENPQPVDIDTVASAHADSTTVATSDTLITDPVASDTTVTAVVEIQLRPCPLQYTPDEACSEETPGCLLYNDPNSDAFCDNPLYCEEDSVVTGEPFVEPVSCTILPDSLSGCPLGLPPEAACPSVDAALCPHFMGGDG